MNKAENKELWKSIEGYNGKYEISSFGRVKSLFDKNGKRRDLILKQRIGNTGYFYINLYMNSKSKSYKTHRLVAKAFLQNPENKETVNHINCIKTDNKVENLEWNTYSENSLHAVKNGKFRDENGKNNCMYGKHGKDNPNSKVLIQKDFFGNIVKIWENSVIAAENLGCCRHSLTRCARGERKSAYGYKWEYANG